MTALINYDVTWNL